MHQFAVYFFDLDGTLANSKRDISDNIAKKLSLLTQKNKVAVISGEGISKIQELVVDNLTPYQPNLHNLYLLPTTGASLFVFGGIEWREIYNQNIPEEKVKEVEEKIRSSFKEAKIPVPRKSYGVRLEYRGSQITFSANGQEAPFEIKSKWDPYNVKRKKIIEILEPKLPEYDVKIGGTNSIDVTVKNIDKSHGIERLCEYLELYSQEVLFVGDALYEGGNDYSVLKSNVYALPTKNPKHTEKLIARILFRQTIFGRFILFFVSLVKKVFNFFERLFKGRTQFRREDDLPDEIKAYVTRSSKNPILSPTSYSWESEGVFNPAAIYLGGRVHLLYRAIGADGTSTIGYASSPDGIHFDERLSHPVYYPRSDFELDPGCVEKKYDTDKYCSGGGWCGCEDPKVCQIEDRVFLFYVAFSGWHSVRVAMSSISVDDFLNKKWNWTLPKLCSPKGVISKSGGIFPEKIKGKFVFFQRIFPNILIDYIDHLRFDDHKKLPKGEHAIPPSKTGWDSRKISFGSVPIKTKHGWLIITHGVDDARDHQYHLGAMMLDLENPEKVLYRSKEPILSPDLWYENDWKPGIIYPCGAVNKDGTLLIYYGGGDKYVCVASAPFDYFVESLMNEQKPKLNLNKIQFRKNKK